MMYDFYKEFDNHNSVSDSTVSTTKSGTEYRKVATESAEIKHEIDIMEKWFPQYTLSLNSSFRNIVAMEAEEDNPFGDIGADDGGDSGMDAGDAFASGDDNPFGDIGSDDGGGGDSDPFGDMGSDDPFGGDSGGDDDPFGGFGDDSGSDDKKKAAKKITLDREQTIKEDFNLSRQIRQNYPKKFLGLKDIITNNINVLERTVIADEKYDSVIHKMVEEYEKVKTVIDAYLDVMPRKTYDDIFGTYVSVHSAMMRLKNMYIKLCNIDDPETQKAAKKPDAQEESADEIQPEEL